MPFNGIITDDFCFLGGNIEHWGTVISMTTTRPITAISGKVDRFEDTTEVSTFKIWAMLNNMSEILDGRPLPETKLFNINTGTVVNASKESVEGFLVFLNKVPVINHTKVTFSKWILVDRFLYSGTVPQCGAGIGQA